MKDTLKIEGMSCHHCVNAVEEALSGVEGVTVERVVLGEAEVAYDPGAINRNKLVEAIEEEGYAVAAT